MAALGAAACGFDSSGNGSGAAEIGDATGADSAPGDATTASEAGTAWASPAGDLVVFASDRGGNLDLYWSVRAPS